MKTNYLLIITMFCGGLASCNHKDLIYDETGTPEVRIVFDWSKSPEAAPESVVAYLYNPEETIEPLRYSFSDMKGGLANVPGGNYVGLGFNNDNSDWARFRNVNDHELIEVLTDDLAALRTFGLETRTLPRSNESASERMAQPAGALIWSDREDNLLIDPYKENQTITFYPEEVTCHYTVTIKDIENIDYLKGANLDATLSGLSESYMIGKRRPSHNPATMPVVLHQIAAKNSVSGSFLNFGNASNNSRKNILTVYLVFEDHTGSYATFDVTDQVRNAEDPHHVNIIVDGLKLPRPIASGSGFVPNVNEWKSVDYTLKM